MAHCVGTQFRNNGQCRASRWLDQTTFYRAVWLNLCFTSSAQYLSGRTKMDPNPNHTQTIPNHGLVLKTPKRVYGHAHEGALTEKCQLYSGNHDKPSNLGLSPHNFQLRHFWTFEPNVDSLMVISSKKSMIHPAKKNRFAIVSWNYRTFGEVLRRNHFVPSFPAQKSTTIV